MKKYNIILTTLMVTLGIIFSSSYLTIKATEITATGTSGSSAIVTDSSGKVITDTTDLSKYHSYNVDWNFSIANDVSIKAGDTLNFELPTGMTANGNLNFDVKNSDGNIIGSFSIKQNDNYGTLTFNDYYETHNEFNRHGTIHITANGSVADSINGNDWNINKVAWVDSQDNILWNIAVNAGNGYDHITIEDSADDSQTILKDTISIQQGYYDENKHFIATKDLPVNATIKGNKMTIELNNVKGIINITYQTKSDKIGTLTNEVKGIPSGGGQQGGTSQSKSWESRASIDYDGGGNVSGETSSSSNTSSSFKSSSSQKLSSSSNNAIQNSSKKTNSSTLSNISSEIKNSSLKESSSNNIMNSSSNETSLIKLDSSSIEKLSSSEIANNSSSKKNKQLVLPNLGSSDELFLGIIGLVIIFGITIKLRNKK